MSRLFKLRRNAIFVAGLVAVFIVAASSVPWSPEQPRAAADLQVTVQQFGQYIDEWSEPEGYFDSDNFISNETSYLHVVDDLHRRVKAGGIYLGVGPDQNFSYIVHTHPMLAVIADIRRQNMLEHLLFKTLFAMAKSRVEYLSLLFSRQTPGFEPGGSFQDLLDTIRAAKTDEALFQKNLGTIKTALNKYNLRLSSDDYAKIEYVYRTFWEENLDLRFSSIGRGNASMYPSFEEMLLETDRQGRQQNYLSSEDSFQWLKKFEAENRVIPIVGDFAGPHAFKAVADFLKSNGLRLSTFYTSNVEFYLFGRPAWTRYVANLRALPLAEDSIFIRSYFPTYGRPHPLNMPGHRSTSFVNPIVAFLADYDARQIRSYWDVVKPRD